MSQASESEGWVQDESWTLCVGQWVARVSKVLDVDEYHQWQWNVIVRIGRDWVVRDLGWRRFAHDARSDAERALRRLSRTE